MLDHWNRWFQKFYYVVLYAFYALYVIALLGLASVAPSYLNTLNMVLKYLIIAFLMIRFNPWTQSKAEFSAFDRSIVFSAAFFLLATTSITSLVLNALHLPNVH